jgi:hypothetical protein
MPLDQCGMFSNLFGMAIDLDATRTVRREWGPVGRTPFAHTLAAERQVHAYAGGCGELPRMLRCLQLRSSQD